MTTGALKAATRVRILSVYGPAAAPAAVRVRVRGRGQDVGEQGEETARDDSGHGQPGQRERPALPRRLRHPDDDEHRRGAHAQHQEAGRHGRWRSSCPLPANPLDAGLTFPALRRAGVVTLAVIVVFAPTT
ncbi:hypothetical protein [Streptomyces sp. NRRL F-2580]|uniref:hypothetical protein n=1 Tax=Streptomyces sp. NRRL F-2580 TaxID=1463841 RepID=UPI0004CB7254|nr:hypothetical protein [Streptomyces sp. NRRL F-2580]